jgi:hypothetical protein
MQFFTVAVLAANAALVSAWCSPFTKPNKIILHREIDLMGRWEYVESGDTCVNIKGSWKSALAATINNCRIYSKAGCGGSSHSVDYKGYNRPGFDIKAIKCPCS